MKKRIEIIGLLVLASVPIFLLLILTSGCSETPESVTAEVAGASGMLAKVKIPEAVPMAPQAPGVGVPMERDNGGIYATHFTHPRKTKDELLDIFRQSCRDGEISLEYGQFF